MLEHALRYVRAGICVVPARPGFKKPRVSWAEVGVVDEAQVREWWTRWPDSGICALTGARSGFWVLDVDPRHGGADTLHDLQMEHGDLPDTVVATTGGGGLHYYFEWDPSRVIRNSEGRLGDGVDVRGEGGLVVLPPTIHASGTAYAWRDEGRPARGPSWIVDLACAASSRPAPRADVPVQDGQKHGSVLALAASMRAQGLSSRAIEAALGVYNEDVLGGRERPEEIRRIAEWVGQKPAGDSAERRLDAALALVEWRSGRETHDESTKRAAQLAPLQSTSDVTIGREALAGVQGASPPCVYDEGALWRCDAQTSLWSQVDPWEVAHVVQSYQGRPVVSGKDDDGNVTYRPFQVQSSKVSGASKAAFVDAGRPGFFAGVPAGTCFSDCFVTVSWDGTIEAQPLRPDHRQRLSLVAPWGDGDARAPVFERYLSEVFDGASDAGGRIRLLLQHAGLCLLGLGTHYQRAIVLYGAGANGKSVFLEVLARLFPEGSVAAIPPHRWSQEYYAAALRGKLINVVNEMPDTDIGDSDVFKGHVDGAIQQARPIREAPYSFYPTAGHFFACNELHGTKDVTHGYWRRFVVLPFDRTFSLDEQDPRLASRIVDDEAAGVLTMLVKYGADALRNGLCVPECSDRLLDQWRIDADQVAQWMRDKCKPTGATKPGVLYTSYSEWSRDNGHGTLSSTKFGRRLTALGYPADRTAKGAPRALSLLAAGEGWDWDRGVSSIASREESKAWF